MSELPKWEKAGQGYERGTKWRETIGMDIKIEYKDKEYIVKVLDYDGGKLCVKYGDYDNHHIHVSSFGSGLFGELLRTRTSEYRYKVGEEVKKPNAKFLILKQIRMKHGSHASEKGYELICEKCKLITNKTEMDLKRGDGCAACSNKVIYKDINSIHATDPWVEDYLVDKTDAYKYSVGSSSKKISFKCNNCGAIKKMIPYEFCKYGLRCKRCSDGFSYPSKIIYNLLSQLGIEFETEKSDFNWLKPYGYRYDFYLKDYNILIEVDGRQHKKESSGMFTPLEEQKYIDGEKDRLGFENGFNVIRIDCEKSELEFIKKSTLNSELSAYFNMNNINWLECHKYSMSSRVKEACDLWNSGIDSTQQIADIMKIKTFGCVSKYLKQGVLLGLTDYDSKKVIRGIGSKNGRTNGLKCSKSLVCLETGQVFSSTKDCSRQSNDLFGSVIHQGNISASCRTGRKRQGYTFKYIEDMTKEELQKYKQIN